MNDSVHTLYVVVEYAGRGQIANVHELERSSVVQSILYHAFSLLLGTSYCSDSVSSTQQLIDNVGTDEPICTSHED